MATPIGADHITAIVNRHLMPDIIDLAYSGNPLFFRINNSSRRMVDGGPQIKDILKVGEVGISWSEGLTYLLKSSRTSNIYTVTSKPRELIPGIFFWIPGFADTRFTPFQYLEPGSTRRLTLPIMFRTAHSRMIDNTRYISSMKDFKAAWPGIFWG